MKKTSDKHTGSGLAQKNRRPVFMAYTINNSQPVICTLVADQPYFYMDDEGCHDEDDILGLEGYEDFEKDMADLKKKMDTFERLAKDFEREPGRRLEEFAAQAIDLCEAREVTKTELLQPADKIISIISQSRMAKSLLDFAQDHGVYIVESQQVDAAQFDRASNKILIHPGLGAPEQCILAVRELRRHWQYRKGVMIHPLTFHPDQAVLINRAQIADLTIAMIRAGWELQLAGNRSVWEYIEHSSLADLGRSFAREAFVDFRSLASGKASSAVFESWFLSDRSRHQDKKLIQAMLADHQGYVFTDTDASRSLSIELISMLGEQPFGKNYLAPYAQMILQDPIFTEVRDRSNANFLWFIKFERSFRETEQALQSEEGIQGDELFGSPSHLKTGKDTHGDSSIIIPLNRSAGVIHRGEGPLSARFLEESDDSANVIHVRFGEGQSA